MELVRKIHLNGKEILVLDYSNKKVEEMIKVVDTAKQLILAENKPVLVLGIFDKNFITPLFMRHLEKEIKGIEHLIDKNGVVGLSDIQLWILKGMNLWYKRQIYHFKTVDEASAFLSAH